MSSARTHARNLVVNWLGFAANLVVMFFLSPFVVHTLGQVEYGIWSLITVLTGYMGIFDLGIRASTGRYIILYVGKEDQEKVDQTIRTGLGFYTAIGALILAIGIALGWLFPSMFESVPREYHTLIRFLLPVMAVNIWISAFRTVLSSVLAAHERFDLARGADLVMLAIRTGGTILLLKLGFGIVGLTAAVVGCNIVGLGVTWLLAKRVHRPLRVWPFTLERRRLREMLGFGLAAFISAISIKIIGQTDLLLVGALISMAAVTVYSVGAMLVYYSASFVGQIGTTFFPALQRAAARGEKGDLRWILYRQLRLAMIFGLPIYIGFIVMGESFISLWMLGPEFPESSVRQAALVMAILSVSKLPVLVVYGFGQILTVIGYVHVRAGLALINALVNLMLSITFVVVFDWGLAGIAAGTLIARLLTETFVIPWYACRKAKLSWRRYVVQIWSRALAAGASFAGLCLALQHAIPATTWPRFFLLVGLALLGYVPIAVLLLVPRDDTVRILRKLRLLRSGPPSGRQEEQ